MKDAVKNVVRQARGKLTALYRTTHFYNIPQMINQYKCHILPIFESVTPAVYHASVTCVRVLQDVQHSFLRTMGLTDDVAFTHFALAPLHLRRDIAMFGFFCTSVLTAKSVTPHTRCFMPHLQCWSAPAINPQTQWRCSNAVMVDIWRC